MCGGERVGGMLLQNLLEFRDEEGGGGVVGGGWGGVGWGGAGVGWGGGPRLPCVPLPR